MKASNTLGWEVGRNLLADHRNGGADLELRFPNAKASVESKVDLILAAHNIPLQAAFRATRTVAMVFGALYVHAVAAGHAKPFSRPGGNVTGVMGTSDQDFYKPIEMMRAIRPCIKLGLCFGLCFSNTTLGVAGGMVTSNMTAVRNLGLHMVLLPDVGDIAGIDPMLAAAKREGIQALKFGSQLFLWGEGFRRRVTA